MDINITRNISIPEREIEISAIRAQGAGGQNVNKVSSAVHLRFDINASSLPPPCKARLISCKDRRISSDGIIVIKAQRFRSQDKNRNDAIYRLVELIKRSTVREKKRIATKPSSGSIKKRLDNKSHHSRQKQLRKKISD